MMEDLCIALSLLPYFAVLCAVRTLPALVSFAVVTLIVLMMQRIEERILLRDPFHIDPAPGSPPTPVCSETSSTDSDL